MWNIFYSCIIWLMPMVLKCIINGIHVWMQELWQSNVLYYYKMILTSPYTCSPLHLLGLLLFLFCIAIFLVKIIRSTIFHKRLALYTRPWNNPRQPQQLPWCLALLLFCPLHSHCQVQSKPHTQNWILQFEIKATLTK